MWWFLLLSCAVSEVTEFRDGELQLAFTPHDGAYAPVTATVQSLPDGTVQGTASSDDAEACADHLRVWSWLQRDGWFDRTTSGCCESRTLTVGVVTSTPDSTCINLELSVFFDEPLNALGYARVLLRAEQDPTWLQAETVVHTYTPPDTGHDPDDVDESFAEGTWDLDWADLSQAMVSVELGAEAHTDLPEVSGTLDLSWSFAQANMGGDTGP